MNQPGPQPSQRQRDAAARLVQAHDAGAVELDRLAGLAARLLSAPTAMVTLLTDVQTVVAGSGAPAGLRVGSEWPLSDAICEYTARVGAPVVIADARVDPRLAAMTVVREGTVVGYLGVPLIADSGDVVGALCVIDRRPRTWSDADAALLGELAVSAVADLERSALSREFDTSQTRWDLAVEAADMGSFELDIVSGELRWDDRLIELFGYRGRGDDEFDGSLASVERRVHPEDMQMVTDAINDAIASAGTIAVRYRIVLPTGQVRWLQARGRVVTDVDDAPISMLGVTFDVTAQQNALFRSELLLDAMPIGVISLDDDFVVIGANSEAELIADMSRAAMIGRSFWDLFPGTVGTVFEETYRRVAATWEPESFEAFYPDPLNIWVEVRAVADADGGIVLTFIDNTEQHETKELLQLSVDVGEELVRAGDVVDAATSLVRRTVPRLADWAIVALRGADGRLRDVGAWHADPSLRPFVDTYASHRLTDGGSGVSQEVLANGEPRLIPVAALEVARTLPLSDAARDALETLAPESVAVLPLIGAHRVVGALTLCRGVSRPFLDDEELAVAMTICRRAGLAIENRELFAALGEAAAHDRGVASALQDVLLTRLPEVPGVELAARYLPAADQDQVGGDWYDALVAEDGGLVLTIGDVVGHDIVAAGLMGQLRSTLRTLAWAVADGPADLLARTDRAVAGMHMDTMASVVAARLETAPDGDSRLLRWSNAGHLPPLVITSTGTVSLLRPERLDTLLGVDPTLARHEHTSLIGRGSTIVLYTDGLIERRTEDIEEGLTRLVARCTAHASATPADLLDALIVDLAGEDPDDDVALLAIRLG